MSKLLQHCLSCLRFLHGKNDFAEGFKILLDTNLKIIMLDHQNNYVRHYVSQA